MLKYILHLTESQAAHFEQKAFFRDACVRDFCFTENPQKEHRHAIGENTWDEAVEQDSFGTRYSFYLPGVSSTSMEIGETSQTSPSFFRPRPLSTLRIHTIVRLQRNFLIGKGITNGMDVTKLPATNRTLLNIRVSAPVQ